MREYHRRFTDGVQAHELEQVQNRRKEVHGVQNPPKESPPNPLQQDLVGLAFSGGGIRSGTFNLGILQALANLKLLSRIDYLSTVSGGGYIGGWLAAWIRRETKHGGEAAILNVEKQLNPNRIAQSEAFRQSGTDRFEKGKVLESEPEPVRHLRAYSRYLSPRVGFLSLDTWSLVALYLRNLLANGLLFFLTAVVLVLLCRCVVAIARCPHESRDMSRVLFVVFCLLTLFGQFWYRWFLADVRNRSRLKRNPKEHQRHWIWKVLYPFRGGFRSFLDKVSSRPKQTASRRIEAPPVQDKPPSAANAGENQRCGSEEAKKAKQESAVTKKKVDKVKVGGAARAPIETSLENPAPKPAVANEKDDRDKVTDKATDDKEKNGNAKLSPKRSESSQAVRGWVVCPCLIAGIFAIWVFGTFPRAGSSSAGCLTHLVLFHPLENEKHWTQRAGLSDDGLHLNGLGEYSAFVFGFGLFGLVMFLAGSLFERLRAELEGLSWESGGQTGKDGRRMISATVIFGCVFGLLFCILARNLFTLHEHATLSAAFGIPLFLVALAVGGYVDAIICGPSLSEYEREWRGRLDAMLLLTACVWAVVFVIVLYVPMLFETKSEFMASSSVIWAASAVMSFVFGRPSKSRGDKSRRTLWDRVGKWVLIVAPPLAVAGLIVLVARFVHLLPGIGGGDSYADCVEFGSLELAVFWTLVVAIIGILYAYLVHPNLFSLSSIWGNRLIRCYLGASRASHRWNQQTPTCPPGAGNTGAPTGVNDAPRDGNNFTGFSHRDDFSLLWLRSHAGDYPDHSKGIREEAWKDNPLPYSGPYPLINTTLNLVAGDELAYQDRKGDSFVITPDYCGSTSTGFARFDPEKASKDRRSYRNLSLGRALAVSAAAVDPNMRNYNSPGLTALLSILNLRFGWWLQNPWHKLGQDASPWLAEEPTSARYMFMEAMGETRADREYVHLSDGGHFENTGAYELIRRRCRYVIVVDAAEDPSDASENLANFIRLVRSDFGIEITIDTSSLRKNDKGLSLWHCAIGAIRYDNIEPSGVTGTLVFIRSSLTGDEPADIRNYAALNSAFPHQPTSDQFFNEEQFESYRALGHHIGMAVFSGAKDSIEAKPTKTHQAYVGYNREFFAAVRRAWAPLPEGLTDAYLKSCRDYLAAVGGLRNPMPLGRVSRSLYREVDGRTIAPKYATRPMPALPEKDFVDNVLDTDELHEIDYLLQVMELAWMENDLDAFHVHPLNRGWMNVLRRWTSSGVFHKYWPILRGQYSRGFVRFCQIALNLGDLPTQWCRIVDPGQPECQQDLADFDAEFYSEWASTLKFNSTDPARYLRCAIAQSRLNGKYFAWILTAGGAGEKSKGIPHLEDRHPLGLVVAFDPDPWFMKPRNEWELLVWIRGPHRTLGLGRDSLSEILKEMSPTLLEKGITRLYARFPRLGTTQGDRLQRVVWTWFFNDHDFVNDPNAPEAEVRLVHTIRAPHPEPPEATDADVAPGHPIATGGTSQPKN
jgi:hypothetical protein